MKYSKQREIVLQIVQESKEHPTAEMVYEQAKEQIPNISLGTVYRNLNALQENGYIKHIPFPNNKDRFDKTVSEHYHLYCLECKRVFDISSDSLQHIDEMVSQETGFQVISHNLIFVGYCHECERKEKNGIKRK